MKRLRKLLMTAGLAALAVGAGIYAGAFPWNIKVLQAAATKKAEVRLIFTTDIHGQLNSMDYERGVDYNSGGLARAYDLIQMARSEKPKGNSLTFDIGDVMYDYTTEYIFAEDQKAIQPIYKAMSKVGYDAVTLGNHDFDYGYSYILNQLKGSGLMDKTVLSNVTDSKTGEYPFKENMIINRKVEASDGTKVEVKIGIIGETIPTLTSKVESYTGVLKTEDMVANVKSQAAGLKQRGADIVVVLAHTGIGPEDPELNFKNVAYALSKIDDVDAILCGHEHNTFPTDDTTSPYLKLPGVDRETYLMNGKNVVMASDRGKSIGLVDLTLEVSGNDVEILDRTSSVRQVKDYKTKESSSFLSLYGSWEDKLQQYTHEVIGTLKEGEIIENFFGLLEDNTAIQLINDAKRSYALRYISTEGTKYKDYPVIAVSTYHSFGYSSYENFVQIKDDITESDLASIQPYNNYLVLYSINGRELREWLEWSASAFEITVGKEKWTDATMSELMKETDLRSLIKEEWLSNIGSFYIFDGIDYTINPMFQPRYDASGNKISNSYRVNSLTYNGKPVTDDMKFIIASDKITKPSFANKGVEKKPVYKKFQRSQAALASYMKVISKTGSVLPTPDYNWTLQMDNNYQFIVKAPVYADSLAKQSNWYVNQLKTANHYNYYAATYPMANSDTVMPNLLVVPTNTAATGIGYNVAVDATDLSGIRTLKYKIGSYDVNDPDWNSAMTVKDHVFRVSANGVYSVYAEDNAGNKVVKQLLVDNISQRVIGVPKLETYTNRKTKIRGTAEPGVTIVISASTGTYETIADISGEFSYSLRGQPSGSKVTVYAMDKETQRNSESITVTVKRTGPNQPSVTPVYNNSTVLSGSINDDDAHIVAIVGDMVYVPDKEGKQLFENAKEIYNRNYTIIETKFKTDNKYNYTMEIEPPQVGTAIEIYNVDHIYRTSRVAATKVKEGGPNRPTVYELSNIENKLTGNVVLRKKNQPVDICASVNGNLYETKTDTEGYFDLEIPEQLQAGQIINVYAADTANGKRRESAYAKVQVKDINNFVKSSQPLISINGITNNSRNIYGSYYLENETIYLAVGKESRGKLNSSIYEIQTDEFGEFSYKLPRTLTAGTKVYALARFSDGGIITAVAGEVKLAKPLQPYLVEDINNSTKKAYVVTSDAAKVTVQIGSKKYTSDKYEYNEELNGYVYTVDTGRADSGTKIKIYAKNKVGSSKVSESKVIKVAPDSPKVDKIFTDSTKITGTIDIVTEIDPAGTEVTSETKVYAQIGKKIYEGKIDEAGNFTIKIKKQKAGTAIYIWGTGNGLRGPLTKVKVIKRK